MCRVKVPRQGLQISRASLRSSQGKQLRCCCAEQTAPDACAWDAGMSRATSGTRYDLCIRQDDMDHVDIQALSSHLRQRRDTVWDNLDICPRTCPTEDSRLCTYKNWFARPADRHARSLLNLPLSMRCMQRLLRFRMGCHKLPRGTSDSDPASPGHIVSQYCMLASYAKTKLILYIVPAGCLMRWEAHCV